MNLWIITGRLGQDPECKYTPSGQAVVNFSVATSRSWRDKGTGEKVEKTEWTPVVFWGKRAEIIAQYFNKGDGITVRGRAETRNWETEGVKHYKTELVGDDFEFPPGKKGGGGGGGYTPNEKDYQGAPGTTGAPGTGPGPVDDDIPF